MINHITLFVSNFEKSKKFFTNALKPLGYKLQSKNSARFDPLFVGFCKEDVEGKRDFWIKESPEYKSHSFSCLAFTATSKRMVDEFYKAALKSGGKDKRIA